MSVRPHTSARGVTTYRVLFRHGKKQRSETFPSEAGAIKFDKLIRQVGPDSALRILAHRSGTLDDSMPTVGQQLERHIGALTHVTGGALDNYRAYAKAIAADDLGALPLDVLTRDDVAAWIGRWGQSGRSAKTTKNYQALLSSALSRAVDDGVVPTNVAARHKIMRTEKAPMHFLTYAEFGRIRDVAHPHYVPLLTFLVATGMRLGEATALRPMDLHLDANPDPTVTVSRAWKRNGEMGPPKTRKGERTISLDPATAALVAPLTVDRSADALLFVNLAGNRILQSTLYQLWATWRSDAGVTKKVRLHDLRHTHAAWMLAQGMSVYDLQHRLGHESIKTTGDTYGHLMPEASAVAARAAGLALAQVPAPARQIASTPQG